MIAKQKCDDVTEKMLVLQENEDIKSSMNFCNSNVHPGNIG